MSYFVEQILGVEVVNTNKAVQSTGHHHIHGRMTLNTSDPSRESLILLYHMTWNDTKPVVTCMIYYNDDNWTLMLKILFKTGIPLKLGGYIYTCKPEVTLLYEATVKYEDALIRSNSTQTLRSGISPPTPREKEGLRLSVLY